MFKSLNIKLFATFRSFEALSVEVKLIAFFTMFIKPLISMMPAILFLMVMDFIFSVYYQYKTEKDELSIKNRLWSVVLLIRTVNRERFIRTFEKVAIYVICLVVTMMADYYGLRIKGLDDDNLFFSLSFSNGAFLLIMAAEIASIFKHAVNILGKEGKVVEDIAAMLKKKIETKV